MMMMVMVMTTIGCLHFSDWLLKFTRCAYLKRVNGLVPVLCTLYLWSSAVTHCPYMILRVFISHICILRYNLWQQRSGVTYCLCNTLHIINHFTNHFTIINHFSTLHIINPSPTFTMQVTPKELGYLISLYAANAQMARGIEHAIDCKKFIGPFLALGKKIRSDTHAAALQRQRETYKKAKKVGLVMGDRCPLPPWPSGPASLSYTYMYYIY